MEVSTVYPKVLIVGRTNVGKSTLFNRLASERKSMVFDREGVTRDYVEETIEWMDRKFDLIDTGGMCFHKNTDDITKQVQAKVVKLLNEAAIVLFVCDIQNGLLDEDLKIVQTLRRANKPIFLLLNKADHPKCIEEHQADFYSLGFKTFLISGIHGIGVGAMLQAIVDALPAESTEAKPDPEYNVVIIGRPNVGKSSLMNLLIQHERSIVSDVAGTTREPITAMTYYLNDLVQFTDTAGVRRSRKIDDDLEGLMVRSSLQSVKEADIVICMIDASEGKIADQELKLLFYAYEQRKAMIVVFNKTDLLDEYKRYTLEESIKSYDFVLRKVPQIWISCATKKNVARIFGEVQNVWHRSKQVFDPILVDEVVKRELANKHLMHNGLQLIISLVKPVPASVPTFILLANHPQWFGQSEMGCVENILRKNYDLLGCPVRLVAKVG